MNSTKKHLIYILTLAIIMIVFSGCSLINTSPSSKGESEGVEEVATGSQEGLNSGNEENDEASNEEDSDSNEIDISDWKTYRNEEYGFEIKYPGDWRETKQKEGKFLFEFDNHGYFWIIISKNNKNLDIKGIKEDFYKNNEYSYQYIDNFLELNNMHIYRQERYDFGVLENFYILNNDKSYLYLLNFEFNFNPTNENKKQHTIKLIDNILNTFKFIK